jgi:hypothetical protein
MPMRFITQFFRLASVKGMGYIDMAKDCFLGWLLLRRGCRSLDDLFSHVTLTIYVFRYIYATRRYIGTGKVSLPGMKSAVKFVEVCCGRKI